MANNIKGITIEIDGNTQGLDRALRDVNKSAAVTSSELKQVERMLKFDPSNVELIAQRQELLNEQIENTSQKLATLRRAQEQVNEQFRNGDIDARQYRAFQREIMQTENYLGYLQNRARQGVRVNATADTSSIERMKSALKELGPVAKDSAKEIGNALGSAGAVGAGAVAGLTVGMQEFNNDLARLRTNAVMADKDLGLVEDAFKKIVAITGETDSAVETVSNLLATGFNENQLAQAIEEINGAAIKFSDTLNTEGIADGIQETFASGASIGMFAELLERSGVDIKKFDAGLAKATKSGEGANYILEQLSALGLSKVSAKFKEMNPEITENSESMTELQTALSDLSVTLTPLMTMMSNFVTQIVKWANENPKLAVSLASISGIVAGIAGALAVVSPIIFSLTNLLPVLIGALGAISAPVLIVIGVLTALGAAFVLLWQQSETFRNTVTGVFESIKKVATNILNTVVSFIKEKLAQLVKFWSENGQQILQAVENAFNGILTVIQVIMPAIEFIVRFVWDAIKNIINGAISVITGAIKVFTGVFTGDFSKMWEGVKDIFKGSIDFIIGFMNLTFIGGIKSAVANLVKTVVTAIKGKWTSIVGFFKSGAGDAFNTIKTMVTNIINSVKNLATNFVGAIVKMKDDVIAYIKKLVDDIIAKFKGMSLVDIGKNIIQGLINGISLMTSNVIEAITGVVNGVINTAKKLLGIKSPSKLFAEFGKFIGIGMSDGILTTESLNKQTMQKLTDSIIASKNIAKKDLIKIDKDLQESIADINEKAEERIYKIQKSASSKKKKLTSDQSNEIHKIRKESAEKIAKLEEKAVTDRLKIKTNEQKNEQKLTEEHYKNLLENVQAFVNDKKSLNQMSLIDEANMWYQSMGLFEEGTKERIKAQQEYKKVYDELNKSFVDTNKTFMDEIKKINEDSVKQEEELTKKYEDAVKRREESLYSYRGLFDAVEKQISTTGSRLTKNLEDQVAEFDKWKNLIEELSKKAIDEGLLNELREMGPKALSEVEALNKMSEPELQKYSNLYKQKTEQARKQAISELEWLRVENGQKLEALRADTATKLINVEAEWMKAVKSITESTSEGFNEMHQIGVNAGQGLSDGLAEMEAPLRKQAKRIADAIRREIEKALDIRSPSHVMEKYGNFIGQGLIDGMQSMVGKVAKSSIQLSNAVTSAHGSLASSSSKSKARTVNNSKYTKVDNTKNFSPVVNVYTTESPEKIMRRELKRMAYLI